MSATGGGEDPADAPARIGGHPTWGSEPSQAQAGSGVWPASEEVLPAPEPFSVGEGERYEVRGLLGVGGMGRVLLAWDRRLRREVALKEVLPGSSQAAARLVREATLTAGLEHPGIVAVHDAGTRHGNRYYVMRVVRGRSLAELLQGAPLSERLTQIRPFLAICQAMAWAHERAVVHRDLKPANVMVGAFGETQVMDWGLALHLGEPLAQGDADSPTDARLTHSGVVVGTPAWMSPEQARGEPVDARSDVWGLGAMLYAILTGGPPFEGSDSASVLQQVRTTRPVPPRQRAPDAPPELCAIADRCLQADAGLRYRDAGALALDVAAWLDGRRVSAHAYSRTELLGRFVSAWRWPLAVAGAGFVLLGAVISYAAVQVVAERDRAVSAEALTHRSLSLADANLAQALAAQAVHELSSGSCSQAERSAARALLLGEPPEARGVLAACGAQARPRRVDEHPLPPCRGRDLDASGRRLVCAEQGQVHLLAVDDGHALASWEVEALDLAFDASGRYVVALRTVPGFNELFRLDLDRPQDPPLVLGGHAGSTVMISTARDVVYQLSPHALPSAAILIANPDHRWLFRGDLPTISTIVDTPDRRAAWLLGEPALLNEVLPEASRTWDLRALDPRASTGALAYAGGRVLVGTVGSDLLVFDPALGGIVSVDNLGIGFIRRMDPHPTRATLLLVMGDGGVLLWDMASRSVAARFAPSSRGGGPRWLADGRLATSSEALQTWEIPPSTRPHAYRFRAGLSSVSVQGDGERFVVSGADGLTAVVDTRTAQVLLDLPHMARDGGVVKQAAFSPDGRLIAVCGGNQGVTLWDASTGALARSWTEGPATVAGYRRLTWLADGDLLVGGWEQTVYRLRFTDHVDRMAWPTQLHPDDLSTSGDRRWALVREGDNRLLRLPLLGPLQPEHIGRSEGVAHLTADGRQLVTHDASGLQRRDIATGDTLWTSPADADLLGVKLSPDDRWVVGAGRSGLVRVWSAADGHLVALLPGHDNRVVAVDFGDDPDTLFTASWDHTVRRWSLARLETPAQAVQQEVIDAWGEARAAR